jgi:hypothetical protein
LQELQADEVQELQLPRQLEQTCPILHSQTEPLTTALLSKQVRQDNFASQVLHKAPHLYWQ